MKTIILQKNKEKSLLRFHPWIFSGAIKRKDNSIKEGDLVEVYSSEHQFLGIGFYQEGSIAIKILTFKNETINTDFWKKKCDRAIQLRKDLGFFYNSETNAFRLINGEGDSCPGLIVDNYNGHLVFQCHSWFYITYLQELCQIIKDKIPTTIQSIYCKSSSTLPKIDDMEYNDQFLYQNHNNCEVLENGHRFYIDIIKGQKTGFFIDQRENRLAVEKSAIEKKVLNLFGYTGGFSVYALSGGAQLVHSVDISERAIHQTIENIKLNFKEDGRHEAFASDCFEYIYNMPSDFYDMIILDPPAFAKHHKALEQGLKGYRNLNKRIMEKIKSGGLLYTFSCSQAVSDEDFQTMIFSAAALAKKQVRIIQRLSQSQDHPINIFHPEGKYLKGFMLYIV